MLGNEREEVAAFLSRRFGLCTMRFFLDGVCLVYLRTCASRQSWVD